MQYYVKIFNKATSELVGYYKETGLNTICANCLIFRIVFSLSLCDRV